MRRKIKRKNMTVNYGKQLLIIFLKMLNTTMKYEYPAKTWEVTYIRKSNPKYFNSDYVL